MLLSQLAIDWSNSFVVVGVAVVLVREGFSSLKVRGIDLKRQNDQVSALHETLCGPNATEGTGASKLYADRDHEKKMLECQQQLCTMMEAQIAVQKHQNSLLIEIIKKRA